MLYVSVLTDFCVYRANVIRTAMSHKAIASRTSARSCRFVIICAERSLRAACKPDGPK
jgi:hypothetical protein